MDYSCFTRIAVLKHMTATSTWMFSDNVGSTPLLPLLHFVTLVGQSLCFVFAIVRHFRLLLHDTTLHCQSNPAVCYGGVTQTPSVWSTL